MLAKNFNPLLYTNNSKAFKISFPAYIQRKLDGIRCLAYMKNNEIIIESRTGSEFENFDILKEQLKPIFDLLGDNIYLDGELYTTKLPFKNISGSVRKSKKHASKEDISNINKIEYHIYDIILLDHLQFGFKERLEKLEYIFKEFKSSLIKKVETKLISKQEDVITYHDKFVNEGFEGLMVRDINGPYEINKRSKYLQKYKNFNEDEFKIINFHHEDLDGKKLVVWDCITKDDKEFAAVPNGTNEYRNDLYKNATKYIGKMLTVIFFGYTEKGSPRFPKGKAIRENY
jgi:DNA ligase-1